MLQYLPQVQNIFTTIKVNLGSVHHYLFLSLSRMESYSISCQKILKFHCKIIIPLHLHPFKYLAWKRFDRSNFLISGPGLTTNALIDAEIVQVFLCYRRFSYESMARAKKMLPFLQKENPLTIFHHAILFAGFVITTPICFG